jgi:tRNA pseudouridine38-40 synthase
MYQLILAYDGTRYFGWQKTAAGKSIQEELIQAIAQITGELVAVEAASRTDRGVHAEGQVAQFSLEKKIDPAKLQRGLNAVLPSDIRALQLTYREFHPTLDAVGKEYHYKMSLGPVQDPMVRLYAWHFRYPLNRDHVERAAQDLIGTHDFSAFANEKEENAICTVKSIFFYKDHFAIQGDRFLYKMVRNLVGTLVYVGCGKIDPDNMGEILASRDRKKGGITAPAHGLYLHQVFYPVK